MTDDKPTPPATSSSPIAQEIAKWLRAVRKGWTNSLDELPPHRNSLERRLRWAYATSGSFTWLIGFILVLVERNPNLITRFLYPQGGEPVLLIFGLIVSVWFGWLIAFVDRKCGPIRLFLDGLLLPTVTVTLIGLSMARIQPVGEESPQGTPSNEQQEPSEPSQDTTSDEQQEPSESLQDTSGGARGAYLRSVPVRDVEDLDVLTRLTWTLQMIFTPGALAHVSPLYAYVPRNPADPAYLTVSIGRVGNFAVVRKCRTVVGDSEYWCADYMDNITDAFNSARRATNGEVYFATTYPLLGIEPEKRFVAERPR